MDRVSFCNIRVYVIQQDTQYLMINFNFTHNIHVMNKINHQILCILLDYIYIVCNISKDSVYISV